MYGSDLLEDEVTSVPNITPASQAVISAIHSRFD